MPDRLTPERLAEIGCDIRNLALGLSLKNYDRVSELLSELAAEIRAAWAERDALRERLLLVEKKLRHACGDDEVSDRMIDEAYEVTRDA